MSEFFEDLEGGAAGIQLYRSSGANRRHVATVTFWDASGQFFVQTHGDEDVPLSILQAVIDDAKKRIKVK